MGMMCPADEASLTPRLRRITQTDADDSNSYGFCSCLRVNKGRQIDGTTLKQFMEVMNEVCYELKKQGININQLARNINAYPDLISMTAFEPFQRVFRQLEDSVLKLYEKVVS